MGILKNSGLDAPLLLNTTIVRREACHYCRLPELITASSSGRFNPSLRLCNTYSMQLSCASRIWSVCDRWRCIG